MKFLWSSLKKDTPIFPKDILISICILFLIFVVYFSSIIFYKNSGDTRWALPVTLSLIKESNITLNEYAKSQDMQKQHLSYTYDIIDGNIYNHGPVGVSVIAIPFVFIIDKFLNRIYGLDLEQYLQDDSAALEAFIASIIVAMSAIVLYSIFRIFLNHFKSSVLTLIFAFCTSAWSIASRLLWQHGPSMLMLSIALYLILSAKKKPWLIQFAGIPLAFSYLVRPTNIVPLFVLTIYILLKYTRQFLLYFLGASLILVPFLLANLLIYDSFISPYYRGRELILSKEWLEGFFGLLFSPGRGLFFFTPILLFSIYGIAVKLKNRTFDGLDFSLVSVIVIFFIGASFHYKWWGGCFFGSRFFTDLLPYFMYFLIPVVDYKLKLKAKKEVCVTVLFAVFCLLSCFIHLRGATDYGPYDWCRNPTNIDEDKSRVWNLKDISFLRPIRKTF